MTVFEWDRWKNAQNLFKHGVGFEKAREAFFDEKKVLADDVKHSTDEPRYYCFGLVDGKVMTVRFTVRGQSIRIIGAGYWREGKAAYETAQR
jgi:hypothetical protein